MSIGEPKIIFCLTEPGNNHGSCDAYDTTPRTEILPSISGSSCKIACINELYGRKKTDRCDIIFTSFQITFALNNKYTFPAPTGPIITTNRPGVTVKFIFSKVLSI